MNIEQRIKAFSRLGRFLNAISDENNISEYDNSLTNYDYIDFRYLIKNICLRNGWFSEENVRTAIKAIANNLNEENLNKWMNKEQFKYNKKEKAIGVIIAGNIPCVGFHDFLCVLITGNKFIGKLSSEDSELLPAIEKILIKIEPDFADCITFVNNKLESFDAIIATGTNNSARYFEYYFSSFPNIIRRNRNSIAILNGKEISDDLNGLCKDIFLYFGRGCRNVSKIYIPANYSFETLLKIAKEYDYIAENKKYYNNYIYNKAILSINNIPFLDNGFIIFIEDKSLASPVSILNYEFYSDLNILKSEIIEKSENIQCVVSKYTLNNYSTPFGKTQFPELWDYNDGVNVISFLANL